MSERHTPSRHLTCPVCRAGLVTIDRQGVEIDVCPECRGIWLDRGELDKILERSIGFEADPPPSPRHHRSEDELQGERGGYRVKRSRSYRSFLADFFD